jgi:hypothetical protein
MRTGFRSVGIGESGIGQMYLYPNRKAFSIEIEDSGRYRYIEKNPNIPILQI